MSTQVTKYEQFHGLCFSDIKVEHDQIKFIKHDGGYLLMHHHQDCCESVVFVDVDGPWSTLIDSPVLVFEKTEVKCVGEYGESETSTFYRICTFRGWITIQWRGTSNGYYSESVSIEDCNDQGIVKGYS